MDSILENQRKLHEERERTIETIVKEIMSDKKTHKANINSQQRVKFLVDRYHGCTENLERIYTDTEGIRKREMEAIAGPNEFAEFYARLKILKDAHRRNPDELAEPLSMEFQKMHEEIADPEREETDMVQFTDEEGYGRFLDMHSLHALYLNLKAVKKIDYITYLSQFDRFVDIPRNITKKTGAYKEYLHALKDYLVYFMDRTRPLHNLAEDFRKSDAEVDRMLADGTLPGWQSHPTNMQHATIDVSAYSSPTELESLGLDRLKAALSALGLKCGGTLKERAERLFASKGVRAGELGRDALAKKADDAKEQTRVAALAKLEGHIKCIGNVLLEERDATRENVERKQARAAGEMEDDEEEPPVESDEEEDDGIPYNPKNLPLGWDGKPIPYWLYKLHGLNISYSCEICGNQVYKGPKAFQKHFNEWRHSHGMRCLGIPNTAHFANITQIKDALDLWNKIKGEKERQKWNPDLDEEFEDSAGNVVNRKMYEDLKRQGLL
ncbi:splicing factor 3A subunit 3 family protein [Necator americanus]|uniref:Splicing factor 3A subunit 3 family protein n=1 Tax=Necator americanus TaxID=51031 RepID=W2T8K9_NECAM|nr:splicing factor 3A subunit 3 family protein [Necator americanus]ETN78330.1 splicing factor 3A subunit 3 family protein [Necator americanus]